MHRLRGLKIISQLSNTGPGSLSCARYFSAHRNSDHHKELQDQVLVEGGANSRAAILNRMSSFNAITTPMAARLKRLYGVWEENPNIGFVLMKGAGGAFCCGGDVVLLCRLLNDGRAEACKIFFQTLYKFVYMQGTYLKPHVAILNGLTMGCGAGICLPGMFRVVTEKTVFTFPECQMGFHPDAGASFYLSRLPGYLGEYLALTGDKLSGVEMISCGLATHFLLNEKLSWVEECLGKLITDDPSAIETSISQYCDPVYPDKSSVLHRIQAVDKCFGHDTIEEIIHALENAAASSYDGWYESVLGKLKEASPLSLKVTLRSIQEGRFQPLDQCLAREYRASLTSISKRVSTDFFEGVRARLIDRDFSPKWDPPRLADVSEEMVNCYFEPLGESKQELQLPTASREPYFL